MYNKPGSDIKNPVDVYVFWHISVLNLIFNLASSRVLGDQSGFHRFQDPNSKNTCCKLIYFEGSANWLPAQKYIYIYILKF